MICIGIDPGGSGGLAFLTDRGSVCGVWPMPESETDVFTLLSAHQLGSAGGDVPHAFIERVHAFPKQGVSSTFKFGASYGGLRMALIAAGIPFEEVLPRAWQKAMGCLSGGDKNVTKRRAQQLFPGVKVTHAIADALLIAEHCRRVVLSRSSAPPAAGAVDLRKSS